MIHASGKGTRTYGDSQEEITVENTDITESRAQFNLNALFGGGVRIPLNKAFIFAEARLSSSFFQSNQQDSRYVDNDLTWVLYHVDSDFRVHQLTICGGICWDLTKE